MQPDGAITVFICDDSKPARMMLTRFLNEAPFDVQIVGESATAQGAIFMMEEETPHIFILKLDIPGDTPTLEVVKSVKALDPNCFVVLCSLPQDRASLKSAVDSGSVDDFLEKPIKRAAVDRAISKFLSTMPL